MYAYLKHCESDKEYAQFTLFFIRNRTDFHSELSVRDVLHRILENIEHSHILLAYDSTQSPIAWVQYWYTDEEQEPSSDEENLFIDSLFIDKKNRSTRTFFKLFSELFNQIAEENKQIKDVRFCALANNKYVNRLYSKFATIIGQRESYRGTDNIYSTDFKQLLHSANRKNRKM